MSLARVLFTYVAFLVGATAALALVAGGLEHFAPRPIATACRAAP